MHDAVDQSPVASAPMRSVGLRMRLGYSVGSLMTGAFAVVPSMLLLIFLVDTLGVPAAIAGLAVSLPKLWDFICDPAVGYLSDRTRSRLGRRRSWMLAGTVVLALACVAMFAVPSFEQQIVTFWWVLIAFMLASTGYAAFQVPYVAMLGEIATTYHERTRVVSLRMVALTLGVLVAGGLSPVVVDSFGGGRGGYAIMGVCLAAWCLIGGLACVAGTAGAERSAPGASDHSILGQLRVALSSKSFRRLGFAMVLQVIALSMSLAALPFFARYHLGGIALLGTLFVTKYLVAMAAMPSWSLISARIGKHRAYMLSMLAYACIVPLIAFVIEPTSHWLIVVYAAGGVAVAGTQIFPYAMIADIADESRRRTGQQQEGTFAGVLVAVEKIGVAGGAALCGVLLASYGFESAQAGHAVHQSPEALSGILVCFGAVPAILMVVAALAMLRYSTAVETSADS